MFFFKCGFLFFSPIVWQIKVVLNITKQHKQEQEQQRTDTTAIRHILNELLMLNKRKANVKNDRSKTYGTIIDDAVINHVNHSIVRTDEQNNFMNAMFWNRKYYHNCKILIVLAIVVCDILHIELIKRCVWQTDYVRRRARKKKIQQKCKDSDNHRNNHNDSNGVCVSIFKNMDILFNTVDVFSNETKYCQSGNINKIEVDDGEQYVDVKISVMITRSTNNVSNEIQSLLIQMWTFFESHLFRCKVDKIDCILQQLEVFVSMS